MDSLPPKPLRTPLFWNIQIVKQIKYTTAKRNRAYLSGLWRKISVGTILLIFPCGGIFSFLVKHVSAQEKKTIYNSAKKYSLFTSFVFHLDYQRICHSPVIYSLFLPEEYEGEKKISALVKMWNRC